MRAAAVTVLAVLGLSAPALAQSPPPASPPASAPAPPPGAAPGVTRLSMRVERAFRDRGRSVAITRQRFRVRGTVAPFVAGQTVSVRLERRRRTVKTRTVAIKPVPGTDQGRFVASFSRSRPGRVTVHADHAATPEQGGFTLPARRVQVLRARLRPGSRGPLARILQRSLAALHYAVPRSGIFDAGTARAVIAYRKVSGMKRVGTVSRRIFTRLARRKGTFRVRHPVPGRHVEADLSRQVLALIVGRRVRRIYMMSSGTGGTPTVRGTFRFYSKTPGVNAKGMVHSNYFIRGYAIHGYASVPVYNASHGCLRIPIPNATSVFSWIRIGDRIDVYG